MIDNEEFPIPEVRPRRGISIVWLLPFIAVAIGAWLVFQSIVEGDIEAYLKFPSGEGLVAGKTEVKYQGITVGVVREFRVAPDLHGVIATVDFDRAVEHALTEGAQFWMVSPEISVMGVSGLNTLVSGSYIAALPGPAGAPAARNFTVLEKAPAGIFNRDGLRLKLLSEDLGSLHRGSPVHYRKFHVGEIEDYVLLEDGSGVELHVFIEQPYVDLIKTKTRFWNSSGIEIDGSLSGLHVRTQSLASIVAGGIAFFTPESAADASLPVEDGARFRLYPDFREANAGIAITIDLPSAEGLEEGRTVIKYRGIQFGELKKIAVSPGLDGVRCTFILDPKSAPALNDTARFWVVKPQVNMQGISGLGNLITGNHLEMDFSLEGQPTRAFVALPGPPELDFNTPGLHLKIRSSDLSSLARGTEIYYRKIPVGSVQGYHLLPDGKTLEAGLFIEPQYAHLVSNKSRFWKAGGVSLSGGLSGIDLRVESLTALLKGGIAFADRDEKGPVVKAKNGDVYALYPSEESANSEELLVTLSFRNGEGLTSGTPVKYQGVKVGEVQSIRLSDGLDRVVAEISLTTAAELIARDSTQFWVVRPQLGLTRTSHLETLLSGPYINVLPGEGNRRLTFIGLEQPPELAGGDGELVIHLLADRLGSIKTGVPIYYRDVQVGRVSGYRLSTNAERVIISASIEKKYAPLVRRHSVFWNASGISVEAGLFKGVNIRTQSVESVLSGGISFATPPQDMMGEQATEGSEFTLHSEPKTEWFDWRPSIPLP
ncbi:MAG: MlaD family protein [Porticoccaceae bacterium]